MDKIKIEAEFDIKALQETVDKALTLDDNESLFNQLASVAQAKAQLAAVAEQLDKVERDAKGLINSKAKALYGAHWQAIKGKGYKITRSFTGSKYEHIGEAGEQFIKVKTSVDSKAVEAYVAETSELPKGIAYNPQRGESIRITVREEASDAVN